MIRASISIKFVGHTKMQSTSQVNYGLGDNFCSNNKWDVHLIGHLNKIELI